MGKKPINEGAIGKFLDSFFDNISKNTEMRMINQAQKKNIDSEAIATMKEISRLSAELKEKLRKYE